MTSMVVFLDCFRRFALSSCLPCVSTYISGHVPCIALSQSSILTLSLSSSSSPLYPLSHQALLAVERVAHAHMTRSRTGISSIAGSDGTLPRRGRGGRPRGTGKGRGRGRTSEAEGETKPVVEAEEEAEMELQPVW